MSNQSYVLSPEANELQPILDGLFDEYTARYGDYFSRDAEAELTEWHLAPQRPFVVLRCRSEIIATGAYRLYGRDAAEIKRIRTKGSLCQQGLATHMVQELERRALLAGYNRIYLTTGFRQPETIRLYLNQGYGPQFDTTRDPEEHSLPPFDGRLRFTKLLTIAGQTRVVWGEKMKTTNSIRVVPVRYPMRAVDAVIALFALVVILQSVAFNPRREWSVFTRWFFDPVILSDLGQTLLLTLIGTLLSILIDGLLTLARLPSSWLLSSLAWGYIWLFRSLPLIVVLIVLYNSSYLYNTLTIGIPFTLIQWGSFETINVLGQFSTAVVGLTLIQGAYVAEIIRSGFLGVDHGQYEAVVALGLPAGQCTLWIILPQALRIILPTGFSEVISLAKGVVMVYVLTMPELFCAIQMIYDRTQEVIPLLMVGAIWYLVITGVLSLIQHLVERALTRSERRSTINTTRVRRAEKRSR